jgi:ATP-dependent Clp protease protease subunit
MRRNWYDIKAAAGAAPAVISIYDDIGGWGITAKDFIASFKAITSNDVELEINSPGGSVFDALAMFNAMKNSGKNITVRVMGIAASAASYIAMVGTKIVMPENTFMMVHNPLNGIYGNAADMREMADVLDKIGNSLLATYVARTGRSDAEIRDLLANDSYLSAAECLALGFADEVVPAITATAKFEREHLPVNIQALFSASQDDDSDDGDDSDEDRNSNPTPDDEVPFATQLEALATAAGMSAYAPTWSLDATITSLDVLGVRIATAKEITALCAVAKQPDAASGLISDGKSLAEARTALCEALAKSDDKNRVDTTVQSSNKPINGAQPSAVKTADVWAARHTTIGVRK